MINRAVPLLVCLVAVYVRYAYASQCTDDNGRSVDYFLLYKLPKLEDSTNKLIRTGYAYAFVSSKINSSEWIISNRTINETRSALGYTLRPLFDENSKANYIVYNDQPPDDYLFVDKSTYAHAKGLFVLSKKSGFIISHSTPKFVSLKKSTQYSFPESARNNGQMFICISICTRNKQTMENIGKHLLLMKPFVYSYNLTDKFIKQYSVFDDLVKKRWPKNQTLIGTIQSCNGQKYTTFSKSGKYLKDIYSQLLAPYFRNGLLVQSWRNGAGEKLDSDCKDQYKTMNIDKIQMNVRNDWKYTEDHSKWAISSEMSTNSTVCIADLNRMKSQFSRGGGSICVHIDTVWNAFNKSIEDVQACPISKR